MSQICSFTRLSSTRIFLTLKSIPTVGLKLCRNSVWEESTKRSMKLVLPTPLSPIIINCNLTRILCCSEKKNGEKMTLLKSVINVRNWRGCTCSPITATIRHSDCPSNLFLFLKFFSTGQSKRRHELVKISHDQKCLKIWAKSFSILCLLGGNASWIAINYIALKIAN